MSVHLRNIHLKLGDFHLKSIHLDIPSGGYHMIAGPSGAGKSLLLELIAGLYTPDSGTILLDTRDITQVAVQQRRTGLLFQDNTLFPHLSVFDNIAFPLQLRESGRQDHTLRIQRLAEELGIDALLSRNVRSLSGGEIQRVSLARLLVSEPEILLLDEPLSAVDIDQRRSILNLLRDINRKGMTILHVTHEVDEVMRMSSTVSVMQQGRIVQTGSAEEVSLHPDEPFVARFFGIRNVFDAEIQQQGSNPVCNLDGNRQVLELPFARESGPCIVYFPNHAVSLSAFSDKAVELPGLVQEVSRTLHHIELKVEAGCTWFVDLPFHVKVPESGEKMTIWVDPSQIGFMRKPHG